MCRVCLRFLQLHLLLLQMSLLRYLKLHLRHHRLQYQRLLQNQYRFLLLHLQQGCIRTSALTVRNRTHASAGPDVGGYCIAFVSRHQPSKRRSRVASSLVVSPSFVARSTQPAVVSHYTAASLPIQSPSQVVEQREAAWHRIPRCGFDTFEAIMSRSIRYFLIGPAT